MLYIIFWFLGVFILINIVFVVGFISLDFKLFISIKINVNYGEFI